MFFVISKVFAPLIHPVTHIFFLLLLALCFHRRPRLGKTCIILALLLLLVFGTYPIPDLMTRLLERQYTPVLPLPKSDAVVVLTGMVNLEASTPDNIDFGDGIERIITGIALVKKGYARTLIITGGSGDLYNQEQSEARLLKQFSIDFGIPEEKILIDPSSRNTYENAVNTKKIVEAHQISSLILVTSASHIPRSMACFKKLGMNPIPHGVDYRSPPHADYNPFDILPSVEALKKTSYIMHEYIGLLMYKLIGYI